MEVGEGNINEALKLDAIAQREARKTAGSTASSQDPQRTTYDELIEATQDFDEILIGWRGNQPAAYNSVSRICAQFQKEAIFLLEKYLDGDDNIQAICYILAEISDEREKLRSLNLPADIGWQRDGEADSEIIELHSVLWSAPKIFGAPPILESMPRLDAFPGMEPPRYLYGLMDSVGELRKLVNSFLRKHDELSVEERIGVYEKYVEEANYILDYLNDYKAKNIPGNLLSATRRRGQGFHQKLAWAARIVADAENELARMKNDLRAREELAAMLDSRIGRKEGQDNDG